MQFSKLTLAAFAATASAQSLVELLNQTAELSNLTSFVSMFPDLLQTLTTATNITIFAPTNDAFAEVLASPTGEAIQADMSLLIPVLQYHVLSGTIYASAITETPAFPPTLLTNTTYTNVTGGQVVEAVAMDGSVEIFSGLLQNSTVTTPNINFTGGVVHIIDKVLTVPENISATASAFNLTAAAGALTTTDLLSTVEGLSDITVFVPNNDAFAAIASAAGNLSTEALAGILQYHVIQGTVAYSSSLMDGMMVPTVGGGNVTISLEDDKVFVNSAQVVTPDVLIANGVVHVIDNVLNPGNATATPNPSTSTQEPAFPGATSSGGVPFTSGVPEATTTVATGGGAMPTASPSASTGANAGPRVTGAVGAAALFGAGAAFVAAM